MTKNNQGFLTVPMAILIAGIIIAGAVIYSSGRGAPKDSGGDNGTAIAVKSVTSSDHILGNPNAKVKIIEYSDTECPFCKRFHSTMHQIVNDYGDKVTWVYRHFPLDSLHRKARREAEATECAAELGGNEKFWAYLDRLFEVTPSNDGLNPGELPNIAEYVGLNRAAFEKCLDSGRHADRVEKDYQGAITSGGRGTPYSIIVAGNNQQVISGAQPYSAVKQAIESLLK